MRQSSTVESSRQTAQAKGQTAPHPVLSTALSTLDIQLEEELARYRRAKAGGVARRSSAHRQAPKTLDLIYVSAQSIPVGSQSTPETTAAAPLTSTAPSSLAAPGLESNLLHAPIAEPAPNLVEQAVELDDYLASSEELLRSLSEEEAKVQAERGFMRSLMTPLGIGSMLLLLLSSAMFGYVVTNPTSLTSLLADRDNTAQPAAAPGPIAPNSGSADTPQPNLANKEFKDLNLNNLATLKPGSATRPIASPSPSAQKPATPATSASGPSAPIEANGQPPQPIPSAPRSPEQPAPNPDPAPVQQPYGRSAEPVRDTAPPRPAKEAPPAATDSPAEEYPYKVVSPYNGDSSLAAAKKAVPDAFLTNSAGRAETQLGAYSSPAEAETQVQDLRRQGIQAEVQKR